MAAREVEQNWPPTATVQETSKIWLQVRKYYIKLYNNYKYYVSSNDRLTACNLKDSI